MSIRDPKLAKNADEMRARLEANDESVTKDEILKLMDELMQAERKKVAGIFKRIEPIFAEMDVGPMSAWIIGTTMAEVSIRQIEALTAGDSTMAADLKAQHIIALQTEPAS